MNKKYVFIFLILLCVTAATNAQQIARDSLRVTIDEMIEAQVEKLTHELILTENQQMQVYSLLLKSINSKNGLDDTFSVELLRILTSQQKNVYLKLQELDKQSANNVIAASSLKSTQTTTAAQNTLTLNDASVIKDAMIGLNNHPDGSGSANNNYSTFPRTCMQAWTYKGATMFKRTVMKFLLNNIPEKSQIVSAKLYLYSDPTVTSTSAANGNSQLSGSNAFYIERITEDWDNNTVTWNNQPASTIDDRILFPASTSTTENIQVDLTDMVQQWVDSPEQNFGIKMFLQTEVRYRARNYGSMDHANTAIHPKLVIEYNDPVIEFTYDDSGNRHKRNVVVIPNGLKSAQLSSPNEIPEEKEEQAVTSNWNDLNITVYPNPTRGDISIKITGGNVPDNITYRVYAGTGKIVCNGLLDVSGLYRIPIASMPPGVYILVLQFDNNKNTWKIIKQ